MKLPFYIAIALSIGFVILSLPNAYIFTDSIIPKNYLRITFDNCPGVPTTQGIVVHAVLFLIFAFLILSFKYNPKIEKKIEVLPSSSIQSSPNQLQSQPNNLKTTKKTNKKDELPIRRKLSSPEPIEMDPFEMYED